MKGKRDFCIKEVYGFIFFFLKRTKFYLSFDWDLTLVSKLGTMSTNKERIENLGASFGDLQTKFDQMEVGVGDKLRQIEAAISRMFDILITRHETSSGSPMPRPHNRQMGKLRMKFLFVCMETIITCMWIQ